MRKQMLFMFCLAMLAMPIFGQEFGEDIKISPVYVADDGTFTLKGIEGKLPWMPDVKQEGHFPTYEDGKVITRAPAPALSALQVYHVVSATASEAIGDYQYTTVADHEGPGLYIYTYEIGYGTAHYTTLDYNQIPQVAVYYLVDGMNNVVGFVRVWDASAYASQQDWQAFSITAQSVNCCGSRSDQLTIK